MVELAPFIFNVKIFDSMNVVDGIAVGIVVKKLGGDFLEAAIKGGVFGVVEGITEINFVKMRESGGELVVVVINGIDVRLPKRKGEVGVGGE